MSKIVKTTDIPADPKRLYIYLYCDKLGCYKSTTKKKAAKSWLSLSESKRKRFVKTCRLKRDLNNTQRVLSTEPFLKQLPNSTVEDISKTIEDDEHNKSCLDGDDEGQNASCLDDIQQNETCLDDVQQNGTCSNDIQQNETHIGDENESHSDAYLENVNDDKEEEQNHSVVNVSTCINNKNDKDKQIERHRDVNSICREINGSDSESTSNPDERRGQGINQDNQETDGNNSNKGFMNNIKEPIPPTVKNWRELYQFINNCKNVRPKDLNVSKIDQVTYQCLFKKLRKEYVEQYIKYLESLSDKQLYEYYLNEF